MGHKGPIYKAWVHWDRKGLNPMLIDQSIKSGALMLKIMHFRKSGSFQTHCINGKKEEAST